MSRKITKLMLAVCLSALVLSPAFGAEAVIVLEGYSDEQAMDEELETQRAIPLQVIGVGQPVYLRSEYEGTVYAWSLTEMPSGSMSELSAADTREVYLIPDMVGSYTVSLAFTDTESVQTTTEITIMSAEYVGVGTIGDATPSATEGQCGLCHPDIETSWQLTGHATITQRDLDGMSSSHIREYCNTCHTTGYDTLAVNGGFDDRAEEEGWVYPDSLMEGNYQDLLDNYPETAQMANVQCEACHGPGSEHKGNMAGTDVSYSYGVCGYCHDVPDHHPQATQYVESAHGLQIEAGEHFNRSGTSCVPCHTAEGFFEVNVGESGTSSAPYASVHGVTCQVCHDPHPDEGTVDTTTASPYQLRVVTDYISTVEGPQTYMTDGSVAKACDVCHHLRPDTDEAGNRPHESHQTDMLNGTVGYRYEGTDYPSTNPHNDMIERRCAGCHMYGLGEGEEIDSEKNLSVGAHTFNMHADDMYLSEACSGCHTDIGDEGFDLGGFQTTIQTKLDNLKSRLVVFGDEAASYLQGNPRYSQDDVDAGTITEDQMYAAYNWYIVNNDGSRGIHNPGLAMALLNDALASLPLPDYCLNCDLNDDGMIGIADVVTFIIAVRETPAEQCLDRNQDGEYTSADLVMLVTEIFSGTCPDAGTGTMLAAAGTDEFMSGMPDLTREEIEYIRKVLSELDLTEEQEAAFEIALQGQLGSSTLPKAFALAQNAPNPFNPATTISYSVPEGQTVHVSINIYDIRGRLVTNLVSQNREPGTYNVFWDGTNTSGSKVSSGVYFYRMKAGSFVQTRKMVLLK